MQNKTYFKQNVSRLLILWNRISLWLGILISLGLSLIGNFQLENSNKIAKNLSGNLFQSFADPLQELLCKGRRDYRSQPSCHQVVT